MSSRTAQNMINSLPTYLIKILFSVTPKLSLNVYLSHTKTDLKKKMFCVWYEFEEIRQARPLKINK